MKCADARDLLSAYLDDTLDANQRARLEDHLRECPACALELSQLKQTLALLGTLEEIEPPVEFHAALSERLERLTAANHRAGRAPRKPWLITLPTLSLRNAIAAALVLVITLAGGVGVGNQLATRRMGKSNLMAKGLDNAPDGRGGSGAGFATGMGGGGNEAAPTSDMTATGEPQMGAAAAGKSAMLTVPDSQSTSQSAQKIIRSGDISLAVDDIVVAKQKVSDLATASGGYIENSSFQQVTATSARAIMQLRVPASRLDQVMVDIKKLGQIKTENTFAVDVTTTYNDADARLKNLKIQETRLQEILKLAATVDDILRVESELNRIRTDIDITNTTLKNLQSGVEMSSLTVNLDQDPLTVAIGKDQSFWNRIRGACVNTVRAIGEFLVGLAVLIGGAMPVIAILVVLWLVLRPLRWFRRGQ